jgi:hypothetical protein
MTAQANVEEKASFLKRPIGGGSGKKPDSAPKPGKFNIPARPQVNLMPPEVLEGRQLVVLKRRLVWAVIFLLVVVALVFAGAYMLRMAAETRHEDSLAAADQLTAQKREYSPVITVLGDIEKTTAARSFTLSTEVNWMSYIYAIEAVLPEGVTMESVSITGISPGAELQPGADDLTRAGIAVIAFQAKSETLPDASEWIEALQSVPGLADANLQSSELADEEGEELYTVSATVQVTEDALANRTFADEAPATEDEG